MISQSKPRRELIEIRPDLELPLTITGVVVHGAKRGRLLGYPTANIAVPTDIDAPEGVFAGTAKRADGTIYRSAISVGRRETFYSSAPSLVEAYLLDFSDDLYGEVLSVELVCELRIQTRFDVITDLVTQIEQDVEDVRSLISLSGDTDPESLDVVRIDRSASRTAG